MTKRMLFFLPKSVNIIHVKAIKKPPRDATP